MLNLSGRIPILLLHYEGFNTASKGASEQTQMLMRDWDAERALNSAGNQARVCAQNGLMATALTGEPYTPLAASVYCGALGYTLGGFDSTEHPNIGLANALLGGAAPMPDILDGYTAGTVTYLCEQLAPRSENSEAAEMAGLGCSFFGGFVQGGINSKNLPGALTGGSISGVARLFDEDLMRRTEELMVEKEKNETKTLESLK